VVERVTRCAADSKPWSWKWRKARCRPVRPKLH